MGRELECDGMELDLFAVTDCCFIPPGDFQSNVDDSQDGGKIFDVFWITGWIAFTVRQPINSE